MKKNHLLSISLGLLLLISSCKKTSICVEDVTIKGRIVDCDGNPVPSYPLNFKNLIDLNTLKRLSIFTDKQGYFSARGALNGERSLVIEDSNEFDEFNLPPISKNKIKEGDIIDFQEIKGSCLSHIKAKLINNCSSLYDSIDVYYQIGNFDNPHFYSNVVSYSGDQEIIPIPYNFIGSDVKMTITAKGDKLSLASWRGIVEKKELINFQTLTYPCNESSIKFQLDGISRNYGINQLEGKASYAYLSNKSQTILFFTTKSKDEIWNTTDFWRLQVDDVLNKIYKNANECEFNPAIRSTLNNYIDNDCDSHFVGDVNLITIPPVGGYFTGTFSGSTRTSATSGLIPFSGSFKIRRIY